MWLSFGMILSDTVKYDLFTARLVGISSSNHVTHDKTMRIPGRTWSWTKKKGWRHWENWTSRAIVGLFKVTWLKPCAVQMIGQLSCQDEPDEPHVLFIYVKDITPKRPLNNGFRAAYFRTNMTNSYPLNSKKVHQLWILLASFGHMRHMSMVPMDPKKMLSHNIHISILGYWWAWHIPIPISLMHSKAWYIITLGIVTPIQVMWVI